MLVLIAYVAALAVAINIMLIAGAEGAAAFALVALFCLAIFRLLPRASRRDT